MRGFKVAIRAQQQGGFVIRDTHNKERALVSDCKPQTPVYQALYDKNGNVTTDVTQAVRVEWNVTSGSKSKVILNIPVNNLQ